MGTLELLWI